MSTSPRRFGEYREMVNQSLAAHGIERDATDVWQTCLRWLLHFQANEYELRTANYSEILHRRKTPAA